MGTQFSADLGHGKRIAKFFFEFQIERNVLLGLRSQYVWGDCSGGTGIFLPAVSGSDNLHHSLYLFRSGDAIQSPTLKEIPLVVIYSMEFEGRIVSRDHH